MIRKYLNKIKYIVLNFISDLYSNSILSVIVEFVILYNRINLKYIIYNIILRVNLWGSEDKEEFIRIDFMSYITPILKKIKNFIDKHPFIFYILIVEGIIDYITVNVAPVIGFIREVYCYWQYYICLKLVLKDNKKMLEKVSELKIGKWRNSCSMFGISYCDYFSIIGHIIDLFMYLSGMDNDKINSYNIYKYVVSFERSISKFYVKEVLSNVVDYFLVTH